jgi:hypothetical protein
MTNLVGGVEDLLPSTNAGNYIWSTQRTALNTTTEYGYFALTGSPILPNIVAGVEIPLFDSVHKLVLAVFACIAT